MSVLKCVNPVYVSGFTHFKRKEFYRVKNRLKFKKSAELKAELKVKSKALKKTLKKANKKFHTKLHKTLRNLKSSNLKEYWTILNNACKLKEKTGQIAIEKLLEHFKKLNTSEADQGNNDPNLTDIQTDPLLNSLFTIEEVTKQITKLRNGKAGGIDAILN